MCVFYEIRIAFSIHPDVRSDQDMVLVELLLEEKGFGGYDRVDAADLVADFPAGFEQVVRIDQFFCHLLGFFFTVLVVFFLTAFFGAASAAGASGSGTGSTAFCSGFASEVATASSILMMKSLRTFM